MAQQVYPPPEPDDRQDVESDDADLVARALRGDGEAFAALFDRHAPRVSAVAYQFVGDRAEAEDITQDAFVQALSALPALRQPNAFGAWVARIAANAAVSSLRQRTHIPRAELSEAAFDTVPDSNRWSSPEAMGLATEEQRSVQATLTRLAPTHRAALALREIGGLSYAEMAQALGITTGGVEALLFRARARFRDEYQKVSLGAAVTAPATSCRQAQSALAALADNELAEHQRVRVVAHVRSCRQCATMLQTQRDSRRALLLLPVALPASFRLAALAKAAPVLAAHAAASIGAGAAGAGAGAGGGGGTTAAGTIGAAGASGGATTMGAAANGTGATATSAAATSTAAGGFAGIPAAIATAAASAGVMGIASIAAVLVVAVAVVAATILHHAAPRVSAPPAAHVHPRQAHTGRPSVIASLTKPGVTSTRAAPGAAHHGSRPASNTTRKSTISIGASRRHHPAQAARQGASRTRAGRSGAILAPATHSAARAVTAVPIARRGSAATPIARRHLVIVPTAPASRRGGSAAALLRPAGRSPVAPKRPAIPRSYVGSAQPIAHATPRTKVHSESPGATRSNGSSPTPTASPPGSEAAPGYTGSTAPEAATPAPAMPRSVATPPGGSATPTPAPPHAAVTPPGGSATPTPAMPRSVTTPPGGSATPTPATPRSVTTPPGGSATPTPIGLSSPGAGSDIPATRQPATTAPPFRASTPTTGPSGAGRPDVPPTGRPAIRFIRVAPPTPTGTAIVIRASTPSDLPPVRETAAPPVDRSHSAAVPPTPTTPPSTSPVTASSSGSGVPVADASTTTSTPEPANTAVPSQPSARTPIATPELDSGVLLVTGLALTALVETRRRRDRHARRRVQGRGPLTG